MEVQIVFDMNSSAWFADNGPADELDHLYEQVTNAILNDPCGPNGFVKNLKDSNGNRTGVLRVLLQNRSGF